MDQSPVVLGGAVEAQNRKVIPSPKSLQTNSEGMLGACGWNQGF